MPKRKQPSKLITKDAAGQPLARRKRRFSHGVERQAANDKALVEEGRESVLRQTEQEQAELSFKWESIENRSEYQDDNDRGDRYLDEISAYLTAMATSRTLLDIAPSELRYHVRARP